MTNPNDPMSLPRPEIGRVDDPRVTAEYLASRPELRGLEPFDPERDVDTLGEVEGRLKYLHSLVAYADPALREDLVTLRDEAQKTLADTAQNMDAQNARLAALNLPPWAVTDNQPGYVEITQLRAGAVRAGTVTLPNTGITLATVEVDLA